MRAAPSLGAVEEFREEGARSGVGRRRPGAATTDPCAGYGLAEGWKEAEEAGRRQAAEAGGAEHAAWASSLRPPEAPLKEEEEEETAVAAVGVWSRPIWASEESSSGPKLVAAGGAGLRPS